MMKAITEKCSTVKKIISAITFCACFALFVNQLIICIEKFNHMETLIQLELVRWVEFNIQQQKPIYFKNNANLNCLTEQQNMNIYKD